jgi:hypothetical protein
MSVDIAPSTDTSVVNQDINLAKFILGVPHNSIDILRLGNIPHHSQSLVLLGMNGFQDLLKRSSPPATHNNIAALL